MGSRFPQSYDSATLAEFDEAFGDVCNALFPNGCRSEHDKGLRRELAWLLMEIAERGVTDPQELRMRTLESFRHRTGKCL
jgi:hypothetical protein